MAIRCFVDFVLSKISREVGTRARGPQAPVEYELPQAAVTEAIVNAIAHRDYASNASVQMMLFADRLEVWNPGHLPPSLTVDSLRVPHASVPHNPLIAEPLFLARYIEHAGTGTLDMIALCAEAGLPAPEFRHDGGQFVLTLSRDSLTPQALADAGLNERQKRAIAFIRTHRRVTNADYRELTGATRKTAARDLDDLVTKKLLTRVGTAGRGIIYTLPREWDKNGTNGTPRTGPRKRDKNGTKGTRLTGTRKKTDA